MTPKLTRRQEEIFHYIVDYTNEKGYSPSIREIGDRFNISSLRGVTVHLDALKRKGMIERSNIPRSIQVTHPFFNLPRNARTLPLVGTIAAGAPILAEENIEQLIPVPLEMVKKIKEAFLLRVRGDSMSGEGILPRDLVVIKPQKVASNGDLVAVLLDGEATVKRIFFDRPYVRLVPSNPSYQPMVVPGSEVNIIGKVIGLLRDYEGLSF